MRIKKISTIISDPISGEWGDEGEGVKVLRTTNFTNEGRLDLSDVVSRMIDQKKILKKKLRVGDTIIEKSGGSPSQPVGRVVYFDQIGEDYLCNNFTSILRLSDDSFDPRYFFWNLFYQHATKKTLKFQNKTTGIINLQLQRYIKETEIKDIPLPTQKHIAAILDKADALRRQNRQLLEHYDALLQSTFMEMFGDPVTNPKGWEVKRLGEIAEISSGGTPSRTVQEYYGGVIPWVKTTEVNGKVILETEESITELGLKNSSCKLYPIGSIIVAMYGQGKTRGQIGLLGIEAATNQACGVLKPSSSFDNLYLFEYLKLSYSRLRDLGQGGNQPNLNAGMLKTFEVLLPALPLQNHFAQIVTEIESQKQQAQAALNESEELFQSLLAKYFGNN